jgi:hypothetical protein
MPDFHRFRLERPMKNVWGEHFDFKIEILEENFRLNSNKYSPAAWRKEPRPASRRAAAGIAAA